MSHIRIGQDRVYERVNAAGEVVERGTTPLVPYPEPDGESATSGWSGSDASHDRALREDASGTTSHRQSVTLGNVEAMGREGLTVVDLREITGWHHGQASGALSVLHKEGRIARLQERRDRCHVYVGLDHVDGRETASHGRSRRRQESVLTAEENETVESVKYRLVLHLPIERGEIEALTKIVERLVHRG